MAIVSVEELIDFMSGITLTGDQRDAAEIILDGVQKGLEVHLNRNVEQGTYTETVTVAEDGYVPLKNYPVASVASMSYPMGMTNIALTSWTISNGLVSLSPLYADLKVTVTYTGGIDGAARPDMRLAILKVASRIMQNRHDDTLSVKDLGTTQDVPPLAEEWTEEELRKFNRDRRRVVR